jgi:hypothetical protein
MTVEELREKLSTFPKDAKVVIAEYEVDNYGNNNLNYLEDIGDEEIYCVCTDNLNNIIDESKVQISILEDKFKLHNDYASIVVTENTTRFQDTIGRLNKEISEAKNDENLSKVGKANYVKERREIIARMLEASEFFNSKEMEDLVKEKMPLNTVVLNLE